MCSIFGVITGHEHGVHGVMVEVMLYRAVNRGRDGIGARFLWWPGLSARIRTVAKAGEFEHNDTIDEIVCSSQRDGPFCMIGNTRAEPTTEWVKEKKENDQQPYCLSGWSIVHNGTIANDSELRSRAVNTSVDSAAIVECLSRITSHEDDANADKLYHRFITMIKCLVGSYAILATHDSLPGVIFTACNYRPIWYGKNDDGSWLASEAQMIPDNCVPRMIEPYTCNVVTEKGIDNRISLHKPRSGYGRALVVASGGMDSTVAAQLVKNQGMDVTLINFQYGCRAESNELKAIESIAKEMQVPLVKFPIPIYDPADSPLFNHTVELAGGEAGAEFAHEWVPARNLVMLSVATAYAEAHGFDYIVLGNNLEEAGAYPDNEPEFVNRFNEVLPFAVGDGKRVRVLMPVGNLMKHEIVAQGLAAGAPLHLTWSCYRNGKLHCGKCGPCMMRRTAFNINNTEEVIDYESDLNERS